MIRRFLYVLLCLMMSAYAFAQDQTQMMLPNEDNTLINEQQEGEESGSLTPQNNIQTLTDDDLTDLDIAQAADLSTQQSKPIIPVGPPYNIVIIGDTLAAQLQQGLSENDEFLLKEYVYQNEAVGPSGIVRDDFLNWTQIVEENLDEWSPAFLIILLGANDNQAIGKLKPRSEEWSSLYRQRVDTLLAATSSRGVKTIWVSVPVFKYSSMNATALTINSILVEETEKNNAVFVDIWDKFTSEDNNFTFNGPNLRGEITKLRTNDGVHFNQQGREKLGFFVFEALSSLLMQDDQTIEETNSPILFEQQDEVKIEDLQTHLDCTSPTNKNKPDCSNGHIELETKNSDTKKIGRPYTLFPSSSMPRVAKPLAKNQNQAYERYIDEIVSKTVSGRSDDFRVKIAE